MFKGFYYLTSGMLTQSRVLNTVSNNMANAMTPGYKRDVMANRTFTDILVERMGNTNKRNPSGLGGSESMIRTVDELVTDYTQGGMNQTGSAFDFAIEGSGFFAVDTADGLLYTRNGSFTLDDEGYLYLDRVGRVMGTDGEIMIGTDDIAVDPFGTIYGPDGEQMGTIAIADFEDYTTLTKYGEGMFQSSAEPSATNPAETQVVWRSLEFSNVSMVDEMVYMMTSQRALQSAAQVLQMHDNINGRAVTEIGKV